MGFFDLFMYPLNYNMKQEERAWQEQMTGQQMSFQREMMYEQMDHQEDFYNQYQSPQAMVRQYQLAGLNPALMYGKGGGMSSPISQGSVPNGASPSSTGAFNVPLNGIVEDVFNILNLRNALEGQKLQNENIEADISLKGQEQKLMKVEEIKMYHEVLNMVQENKKLKAEIKTEAAKLLGIEATTELTTQQAVSEVVRQNLMEADILLKGVQVSLTTADRELKHVQKQLADKQIQYIDEQKKTEVINQVNKELEGFGLSLKNLGLDIDNQGKLVTIEGQLIQNEKQAIENAIYYNTGMDSKHPIFGPVASMLLGFISKKDGDLWYLDNNNRSREYSNSKFNIKEMRDNYWEYRKRIYDNYNK